MNSICLDTGIFSIYFEQDSRDKHKVMDLFQSIKNGQKIAHVMSPVISELYYHLCKAHGKESATASVLSMLNVYPLELINPNIDDLLLAGQIKCDDRVHLSYVDCLSIAHSLNAKIPFYTTEKFLKQIPEKMLNRLKIVSFWWD